MAAWILKNFGSCWNYIYFPPFLCLNLKGLNILCFPSLALLYHIYLCFCVITIDIRCAFRLLMHFRADGLQMDSRSSHLPMWSLSRKHHRLIFRPSYHMQIFLQKHPLSLVKFLLLQFIQHHFQELLFTADHVHAHVSSPWSSKTSILFRDFIYTKTLIICPIFYNNHSLD